jgi:hypothetical protein
MQFVFYGYKINAEPDDLAPDSAKPITRLSAISFYLVNSRIKAKNE